MALAQNEILDLNRLFANLLRISGYGPNVLTSSTFGELLSAASSAGPANPYLDIPGGIDVVASATIIAPETLVFAVTGAVTIQEITPPVGFTAGGPFVMIPTEDIRLETVASGTDNIALGVDCTAFVPVVLVYDGTYWYPMTSSAAAPASGGEEIGWSPVLAKDNGASITVTRYAGGSYTSGVRFRAFKEGLTITGARGWSEVPGAGDLKVILWDTAGVARETKTVSVLGPGYFEVTFDDPVVILAAEVGLSWHISVVEVSTGGYSYIVSATDLAAFKPPNGIFATASYFQWAPHIQYVIGVYRAAGGDGFPETTDDVNFYPLELIVS